ncbi:hypothetical protein DY245_43765 [Streptomyces inhibens]|uniref:Uncharacterized protein n=1 Tax=Streptomyces inhibens TaxID=2293571 RepID=A0A371PPV7_STRIH|nr:hypothetical protein [Streptomyces inhibens]REK84329.1 hypothetical protein DY245_43765 [Streptomyces inhibens]
MGEARTDRGERREDLTIKLASAPKDTGNGCIHVVEGIVLALVAGLAGKYFADERDLPWLTAVGVVVAVLIVVATIAIVRGETRDARRAQDGAARAAALTAEARFCYTCQGVFYPSGYPSPGIVTPEQFRQHVRTAAGHDPSDRP